MRSAHEAGRIVSRRCSAIGRQPRPCRRWSPVNRRRHLWAAMRPPIWTRSWRRPG